MKLNNPVYIGLLCLLSFSISFGAHAAKKPKLRLSVKYVKVMNEGSMLEFKATLKGDDGVGPVKDVSVMVYQDTEDTSILLGNGSTNGEGEGVFQFKITDLVTDTSGRYLLRLEAEGNDVYRGAEKEVAFRDGQLTATLEVDEDGIPTIQVQLIDVATGEPAAEQPIFVGVKRLFKPLPIGDDLYDTDEDGMVYVLYEDSIPSVDGNLTIMANVEDSEDYGWIKTSFVSDLGRKSALETTFDQRTMWSPPSKTPWVLLIFPNLIILGVWSMLVYLILNLYKIKQTK